MLNIISGEAGTGKSTLLRERIKRTVEAGGKAVLFVPDQFSFEAEKLIYRTVPHTLSENCRVTMFSREAQSILRLNGETKVYADDISKRLIIKIAVDEAAADGSLSYYHRQSKSQSFPEFALGMISDMRNAGLSPSGLKGLLAKDGHMTDRLTEKMNDIAVIYAGYDEILTRNFSDRLDDVRRAAEIIRESDIFDGHEIFFDEFDTFSGTQLNFIRTLLGKGIDVTIAMTCDGISGHKDRRFDEAYRILSGLSKDIEKNELVLEERFRKPSELKIVEARDKWQECDWICSEIRSLMDSGVRCREIAVLAPDIGSVRVLDSTMRRYGIPAFTDIPEPLISKWFVRFPIYALRALSFETEDILRYVKSGFVRNSSGKVINGVHSDNDDADRLERLCRTYDLRKRDWLKPFPAGADPDGSLEELRKCVILPLRQLANDMGISSPSDKADGALLTKLLCEFICDKMRITDTIYSKCIIGKDKDHKNKYDGKLLDALCEIWDDTVTVFESAYKALDGHTITLSEFTEILTDIFTSTTISKPPQTLDAVTVGDTERSRFTNVRYVFICGYNRGIMPPPARISEVFTPSEREYLSHHGIPVADDRRSRWSKELFTVYRCANIPSQRLYVTYPLMSVTGAYLEPAEYIDGLRSDFSSNSTVSASDFDAAFYCRTMASSERYLAHIYREPGRAAERAALKERVNSFFVKMLNNASGLTPDRDRHRITPDQASSLITMTSWSPSALGLANDCKFAFFCKYGLGLREDSTRSIDAVLAGNVIHFCLERLLKDHLGKRPELLAMTHDQVRGHVSESIDLYEEQFYFGGFGGAKRFSYLLHGLGRYAVMSAEKMQKELAGSSFYPEVLEQKLSFPFCGITIDGKCDRMDSAVKDGKRYVRIIDYKRSKRDFQLSDIYNGTDLQTLLYMFGECSIHADTYPSSVLYVPVGKMSYASEKRLDSTSEAGQKQYMRDHTPSGLILSNSPEAAETADINAALNEACGSKRAVYYAPTQISKEVYGAIQSYCGSYISSKISEVMSGMAGACPSGEKACAYCGYKLFCGKNS